LTYYFLFCIFKPEPIPKQGLITLSLHLSL
jgi:hypothetical protein